MSNRSFSEEERRQREREERSRQRKQEQAYREAERDSRAQRYEDDLEQDLLWGDPRDRLYDRVPEEDEWEVERRQIREELWDDPWPKSGREHRAAPHTTQRGTAQRPRPSAPQSHPAAPRSGPGRRPKKRRRKALLIVLLVLLALVAAGLLVKVLYIRPPELPVPESQEAGTDPGSMGAGRKEDVYTFLLVGRDDGGGGKTDTIMVGCFDVKNKSLDVLSIYRDTYVDVPLKIPKINGVYNEQGIEGLLEQVKNLIGYPPDFYFVVELDAVSELVDAIGGVDYDVPYSMHYDDPSQNLHIHYEKGMQHINGDDAVKILRWRKNNSGEKHSVGDVGRVEIQHSFLKALSSEMLSLGTLTKVGDIIDIANRNLKSNLDYGEMLWFGEKALGLSKENIHFHNLPGDYTGTAWSSVYKNYQSYVFVNSSALRDLVNQNMNPYLKDITPDMQHVVHDTTVNNIPAESEAAGSQNGVPMD